jgi:hypothetical protein
MKSFIIAAILLLLSGCAINLTTDSFVYQDKAVEAQLNLTEIKTKITDDNGLINLNQVEVITSDNIKLKGVEFLHNNAIANIVLFGGNGMKISKANGILNQFSQLPANIIWFDYRGVGVSEKHEQLRVRDLQQDALVVYDFAHKHFSNDKPVLIHGISMGSLLATFVAGQRPIDGLILDGAISTVPDLIDNITPTWSKIFSTIVVADELNEIDNIELIKKYHNPLLFLASENDEVTPVNFSQALLQASDSREKSMAIIQNIGHGQTMKTEQALKQYIAFIDKLKCCNKS